MITSKLSERSNESADRKMERGEVLNPEYSIDRDQSTSQASPLRINVLLSTLVDELFNSLLAFAVMLPVGGNS